MINVKFVVILFRIFVGLVRDVTMINVRNVQDIGKTFVHLCTKWANIRYLRTKKLKKPVIFVFNKYLELIIPANVILTSAKNVMNDLKKLLFSLI